MALRQNSGLEPLPKKSSKKSRDTQGAADQRPQFYGRRFGKKLRQNQKGLVENLLPGLRLEPISPDQPLDPATFFDSPKKGLWMEIGFGAGEHLAGQADRHPDIGFIGSEPFINGVASYLSKHEEQGLQNVRLFDNDVRLLLPTLPDACLDRLYILFADPWPKKRHHRRRMINPDNLDQFARLLKPGADLWFATDHMDYARWGLWHLLNDQRFDWPVKTSLDWQRPADWIATRYEQKALSAGGACVYFRFKRV